MGIERISKGVWYKHLKQSDSPQRCMKEEQYHYIEDVLIYICGEFYLVYSWFQKTRYYGKIDIYQTIYRKVFLNNINDFDFNILFSGVQ